MNLIGILYDVKQQGVFGELGKGYRLNVYCVITNLLGGTANHQVRQTSTSSYTRLQERVLSSGLTVPRVEDGAKCVTWRMSSPRLVLVSRLG